jgi:1-aminocyclopropane-1-carboxylate deaminase/D-cysteine desulfhydrase-like pyridoxal-dependent ACC family enzyme
VIYKVFIGILAIFLLLGAFSGAILDGIKGWRTEDTTQSYVVATGAGVTTANVTLSLELYNDEVTEVISVTSNETETPIASSYDDATQKLLIAALNANDSRTLTVNYYGLPDDDVMNAIGPFLGFIVIGGLVFAIVYGVWKGRKGR